MRGFRRRARKLVRLLRVPSYRRAWARGVVAATEHESVPYRHDFRTVIDVGASRGHFALTAQHRFPGASLVCVEPLPEACVALDRCLDRTAGLKVVDAAAAAAAGEAQFHVSRADDSSSLLPITETQETIFPGTDAVAQIGVRTVRLDEVVSVAEIKRPALLKLDVQGGELAALQGAGAVLDEVDTILVECSFVEFYEGQALADDVIRFLHGRRFRIEGIRPGSVRDGLIVQTDILFERYGDPVFDAYRVTPTG